MKDAWQVCTNQLGKDRLSLNSSPLPLKCFYIADNLVFLEGCSYKDTKNNFIEFIYQASIDIWYTNFLFKNYKEVYAKMVRLKS